MITNRVLGSLFFWRNAADFVFELRGRVRFDRLVRARARRVLAESGFPNQGRSD